MIKIMFVCHGNICRSTMAEAIAKDMIIKRGLQDKIAVASCATSCEELGNEPDARTMKVLNRHGYDAGVLLKGKRARQVKRHEYADWDYFFVMDDNNIRNLSGIFEDTDQKVYKIATYTKGLNKNVADPWYSGDFETTYQELIEYIAILFDKLIDGVL